MAARNATHAQSAAGKPGDNQADAAEVAGSTRADGPDDDDDEPAGDADADADEADEPDAADPEFLSSARDFDARDAGDAAFVKLVVQDILTSPAFVDGVHALVTDSFRTVAAGELLNLPAFDVSAAVQSTIQSLIEQGKLPIDIAGPEQAAEPPRMSEAERERILAKQRKTAEAEEKKRREDAAKRAAEGLEAFTRIHALAKDAEPEALAELRSGMARVTILSFGTDETILPDMPPIRVDRDQVEAENGRAVIGLEVEFAPELAPARVTEAWLVSAAAALRCEIPGGLTVGGGKHARIPASSLIF